MSKFQGYVPQPFAIYQALPLHPDFPNEQHYQTWKLSQCKGDYTTFEFLLPFDGTDIAFPPFVVKRPSGGGAVGSWTMIAIDATDERSLTPPDQSVENLDDVPDYEAVIFPSQSFTTTPTIGRHYYIKFNDGTNYWYSDIFTFVSSPTLNVVLPYATMPDPCGRDEFVQLTWSNPGCVISETIPSGTSFMITLPVNVSQPEYNYKPDTEDDGQGGEIKTFQRMDKRWSFFIYAPEYIADAFAAMQMFSAVGISMQYGDALTCRNIEVGVDWKTPCFAEVKVSFEAEFLSKTACC